MADLITKKKLFSAVNILIDTNCINLKITTSINKTSYKYKKKEKIEEKLHFE